MNVSEKKARKALIDKAAPPSIHASGAEAQTAVAATPPEQLSAGRQLSSFAALAEHSGELMALASTDGHFCYLNKKGRHLLGWHDPDALPLRSLADCHPAELQPFIATELLPRVQKEGVWEGQLPLLIAGQPAPLLFQFRIFAVEPAENPAKTLLGIIAAEQEAGEPPEKKKSRELHDELEEPVEARIREISESNQILMKQIIVRQQTEEELRRSEEKFRLLFNSGNDAIFAYHLLNDGKASALIEVNDVACKMCEASREELLRLAPEKLFLNPDEQLRRERIDRLREEQHILYEDIFLSLKGSTIPVEINAHLFELDGQPAVLSIARDISSRKRAEKQIREQAALLDKAQNAIMVCDLNDYITYWNKSAERLYGLEGRQAIGNSVLELLYRRNSEQFRRSRRTVLSGGEWSGEVKQVTPGGREVVVESRWTLIRDQEGQAHSVLMVNSDITEKKQIEAQFFRAQRMESIGALAGGIAHDLNNILTPIMTALQILEVRNQDEKSQHLFDTISKNLQRGAEMISKILAFARGVGGEKIAVDIPRLIRDLSKTVLEAFPRTIEMEAEAAPDVCSVSGDPTQLHQVLLNLCVNARDAMPEGGVLTIRAENVQVSREEAGRNPDAHEGRYVRITTRDNGMGMSKEILQHIFEPFYTTKEPGKGTGLGLSTVASIVKGHGGFVQVHSMPGEGTAFEVYLPVLQEQEGGKAVRHKSKRRHELPAGNQEVVLLVDDEEAILDVTRDTLESYGYRVMVCRDGAEAVALYAQHKEEVAVVIIDMMMPVMDGAAAMRALSRINPAVKIIASSGLKGDQKIADFVGQGVVAFLYKPYTAEALLKTLSAVLTNNPSQ